MLFFRTIPILFLFVQLFVLESFTVNILFEFNAVSLKLDLNLHVILLKLVPRNGEVPFFTYCQCPHYSITYNVMWSVYWGLGLLPGACYRTFRFNVALALAVPKSCPDKMYAFSISYKILYRERSNILPSVRVGMHVYKYW